MKTSVKSRSNSTVLSEPRSLRHPALQELRGSANFERIEYVESETQTNLENECESFNILNEDDFSRSVTDAINVAEELLKQSNTEIGSDYDPSLYTDDGRYDDDRYEKFAKPSKHPETDNFYQLNNVQENQIDTSLRRLYALEKYLLDDPVDANPENYAEIDRTGDDDELNSNVSDVVSSNEESENLENNHDDEYQELFYDRYFNKFFNPESGEYHKS